MEHGSAFTSEELSILSEIRENPNEINSLPRDDGQQAADSQPQATQPPTTNQEAAAPVQAPAAPAPAAQAPAAQAPAAPAPPPQGGDPRAALRAARRAENQWRAQAEALAAENERLRQAAPTPPAAPTVPGLTEEQLAALDVDQPEVAKALRELAKKTAAAAPASAPAAPAAPEFIPAPQTPEVQDAIDANAELVAWQNDPDQTRWQQMAEQDAILRQSSLWSTKPMAERFAEAARRVKADNPVAAAPHPAQTDAERAAALIAAAATVQPSSVGDLKGGAAPDALSKDYSKLSDADVMADLARLA